MVVHKVSSLRAPTSPPALPVHTLPRLSPAKLFQTLSSGKRSRRRRLSTLQYVFIAGLLLVAVTSLCQLRGVRRQLQDTFNKAYYGLDARMLGRREVEFPVGRCCVAESCVEGDRHRYALVTYIRTDAYLPLLQQLECTARRSNPWLDIAVMVVPGELSERVTRSVHSMNATIIYVKRLEYTNDYETRYSWNWLKIRAFGLTQYDAILLMDSDAILVGSVRPLFSLPTDFAAVWDQSRWMNKHKTMLQSINGGVLFIRPCAATEQSMMELLSNNPKLRFSHGTAEQDFFAWYFRYTGMLLPLEWNAMAAESLEGDLTVGGLPPRVVHFTSEKPFNGPQGLPGHQFLCDLSGSSGSKDAG